jgi:PleD family two-component response regulator
MQGAGRVEVVLKRADEAMYAAKAAGRNRVHVSETDESCPALGQTA